jgi:hypothetical protein
MSNAFDMPIPSETAAGVWLTNINSSLTLKPRKSSAPRFHEQHLHWFARCDAEVGF